MDLKKAPVPVYRSRETRAGVRFWPSHADFFSRLLLPLWRHRHAAQRRSRVAVTSHGPLAGQVSLRFFSAKKKAALALRSQQGQDPTHRRQPERLAAPRSPEALRQPIWCTKKRQRIASEHAVLCLQREIVVSMNNSHRDNGNTQQDETRTTAQGRETRKRATSK